MHRLGASAILLFKMANLKNQMEDSMDVLHFFHVCFRIRTVQVRNGEWRGFFQLVKTSSNMEEREEYEIPMVFSSYSIPARR